MWHEKLIKITNLDCKVVNNFDIGLIAYYKIIAALF